MHGRKNWHDFGCSAKPHPECVMLPEVIATRATPVLFPNALLS